MAPKQGMSGWLIALLVILVIFIIVMIVLAIVSSSSNGNPQNPNQQPQNGNSNGNGQGNDVIILTKTQQKEECSSESSKSSNSSSSEASGSEEIANAQSCRNIDILYASISLSTGEFIQNAKNGSKRVGNSFKNMNKHAIAIGDVIRGMHHGKYGNEYSNCLLQKNQIYKTLVEHIIVKGKTLNPNDHLLHGLNDINEKMGAILVSMNGDIKFEDYVSILHQYDVLVVKQIHFMNENDHDAADQANQQAQITLITISSNSCK